MTIETDRQTGRTTAICLMAFQQTFLKESEHQFAYVVVKSQGIAGYCCRMMMEDLTKRGYHPYFGKHHTIWSGTPTKSAKGVKFVLPNHPSLAVINGTPKLIGHNGPVFLDHDVNLCDIKS